MSDQVDYKCKAYNKMLPLWLLIKDVLTPGAVKGREDKYLPRPAPTDKSDENKERYKAYLTRALFFDVTARTLRGLIGQVFSKPEVITLPEPLEVLETDVDGAGVTMHQQARLKSLESALLGLPYCALGGAVLRVQFRARQRMQVHFRYEHEEIALSATQRNRQKRQRR